MVAGWAEHTGVEVLIGRISNLYGPRQNLFKRQGFISHLLGSMHHQQPFVFSVPASTIRDFVYTDDVGARVGGWLTCAEPAARRLTVKILAAERSASLAHVSVTASRVTHRAPRVLFAPRGGFDQPAVIRFGSTEALALNASRPTTSLEHGLWLTWQALLRSR
jgi:UDP-glucose 4-epimerase